MTAHSADTVRCTCYAWDPEVYRHDESEHEQDCRWAKGCTIEVPCGGCWGCLSAQVAHAHYLQRLNDGTVSGE